MRNKLTDELAVCGFNAVSALVQYHPENINRLFLRSDRLPFLTGVCKDLAERKRPYKLCEDEELERICKSSRHQGVVAMIKEPVLEPINRDDLEVWEREGLTGLIVHSVGNDHNLGAMIRSAAFFEVHFVIIYTGDAEAKLTTSAYRVAEGGMEHITLRCVHDLNGFLKTAMQRIVVIGTTPRARLRIRDMGGILHDLSPEARPGVALVVGNEERGLPEEIRNNCSFLMRIPGTGLIDSLNVAQCATLFFHELYEL
ncbi:MAG: RNA methyltransferase [Spirochaetaceae bacterium]|jgi:TrmH RNA methyltransferase|nr:RNA methyltransferase [Spirochaetaceae bacterium]